MKEKITYAVTALTCSLSLCLSCNTKHKAGTKETRRSLPVSGGTSGSSAVSPPEIPSSTPTQAVNVPANVKNDAPVKNDTPVIYASFAPSDENEDEIHGIFISRDQGITWKSKSRSDGLPNTYITAIFALRNNVYIGSQSYYDETSNKLVFSSLRISRDGGETWGDKDRAASFSHSINGIYATDSEIYLTIENEGLFVSRDGGGTFSLIQGGAQMKCIGGALGNIYVGTENGLLISKDYGKTFTSTEKMEAWKSTGCGQSGICGGFTVDSINLSGTNVYAGKSASSIADSGIMISGDSGVTWRKMALPAVEEKTCASAGNCQGGVYSVHSIYSSREKIYADYSILWPIQGEGEGSAGSRNFKTASDNGSTWKDVFQDGSDGGTISGYGSIVAHCSKSALRISRDEGQSWRKVAEFENSKIECGIIHVSL
ncbi:MAG: hypothetical protein HQK54_10375 [Oligoflexales bacterium]|nr:hypothetical protein [Oligoflexales bacterium]